MSDSNQGFVLPFLAAFDDLCAESNYGPCIGSPSLLEAASYSRAESVRTAYAQAAMALASARDHLEAVDLIVRVGQPSVAHLTCLRGLLEASSIASWLFDPAATTRERVSRSMALRFNTLKEQRKQLVAKNDAVGVAEIDERILEIESVAQRLGFSPLRNRKGQRDGIGQRKPTFSDMVGLQFESRSVYSILSGIAHSDFASVMSFGFAQAEGVNDSGQPYAQRKVNNEMLTLLMSRALTYYVRPLWMQVVQFGFDRQRAARILESTYNQLALSQDDSVREWRRDLAQM